MVPSICVQVAALACKRFASGPGAGVVAQRAVQAGETRPAFAHRDVEAAAVVAAVEPSVLRDVGLAAQRALELNGVGLEPDELRVGGFDFVLGLHSISFDATAPRRCVGVSGARVVRPAALA